MASILNVFEPKTKIKSSEVNENFELVQKDVSEMGQALNAYVEGEIASVQSTVSSVQATLQENINTISSKLSNIYDDIAPNYDAGYSVSSGWTAPQSGWLVLTVYSGEANPSAWYIAGKMVAQNSQGTGGNGRAGGLWVTAMAFISKGQILTKSGSHEAKAIFYPCVGN